MTENKSGYQPTNNNYITIFSGKPLIATYQVKGSDNNWFTKKVRISSQEEFNHLIKVCQHDDMNLVDVQEE